MKILLNHQIRELDKVTTEEENIRSVDLMERASEAVTDWIVKNKGPFFKYLIFCGPGNNGGDGLAVARQLSRYNYTVGIYLINTTSHSPDFQINLNRINEGIPVIHISNSTDFPSFDKDTIVVDALFGSGLNRPVEGIFDELIQYINESLLPVISIDIASGLFSERALQGATAIRPDHTLTFQLPKLALLLPENEQYVGKWELLEIGLSKKFIDATHTTLHYIDLSIAQSLLKRRTKFTHKGTNGHALVIAGKEGSMGASVLCVRACYKAGAGLVTALVPGCGVEIMQQSVPEALVIKDQSEIMITQLPDLSKYNAIGVGPGISEGAESEKLLECLFDLVGIGIVIDASALNILSRNEILLSRVPAGSVFTPHPKEFERLMGKSKDDYHRLELLQELAKLTRSVVVLKGAHTVVCSPEGDLYFNSTGNPGMAKGGSGDVLTGIITSLMGQRYSAIDAALLGVYLHGLAGDIAVQTTSEYALMPSDIIENIGKAYTKLG